MFILGTVVDIERSKRGAMAEIGWFKSCFGRERDEILDSCDLNKTWT